jgi:hypothetical protein
LKSSGVSLLTREDKTAQHLFAMQGVHTAGETTEATAQMAKEAFRQVVSRNPRSVLGGNRCHTATWAEVRNRRELFDGDVYVHG